MLKVGVYGANGRVGKLLVKNLTEDPDTEVAALCERDGIANTSEEKGIGEMVTEARHCMSEDSEDDARHSLRIHSARSEESDVYLPHDVTAHRGRRCTFHARGFCSLPP